MPSAGAMARARELHSQWYGSDKSLYDVALALDAFARERVEAVWEEAAKIADTFVEAMTPQVAVDTGRMWRSGQATNIAAAIRTRAAEAEHRP